MFLKHVVPIALPIIHAKLTITVEILSQTVGL